MSITDATDTPDVLIVGAGVAGLSAGIFTARHGCTTTIADGGDSLLRRNAHLENYPGFPAGVNSRLLLDMMRDQAVSSGCTIHEHPISAIRSTSTDDQFLATTDAERTYRVPVVIVATKNTVDFLSDLDVDLVEHGKTFLETDDRGRTSVPGLYAAGRIAGKPHQTVVCAGHGAEVAVTVLEDSESPFYHDWVAPDEYFTGRGRDVPPGCEEIAEDERLTREQESMRVMTEYFSSPHPDRPQQHPSVDSPSN